MVLRCVSSLGMTALLSWRNPEGSEKEWSQYEGLQAPIEGVRWRVIVSGFGASLLALVALVESVAYGVIFVIGTCLLGSQAPFTKGVRGALESSGFTLLWGVNTVVVENPLMRNVITEEALARMYVNQAYPIFQGALFREQDRVRARALDREHQVEEFLHLAHHTQPKECRDKKRKTPEERGTDFLVEVVLAGQSEQTLRRFCEADATLFPFILSRAVALFVVGEKREYLIPEYFKNDSADAVRALRKKKGPISQMMDYFETPEAYEKIPRDDWEKQFFNEIRGIGYGELRGGQLAFACWQKAAGRT